MSFDTPDGTRGSRLRGPSGPVGRWMQRMAMRQHRKSWKFTGADILFLTTIGRRSGQERTTPLAWFPGGDGTWLIVASAAGTAQNPAWYRNIAAHPDRVQIEWREGKVPVTAEQLAGAEREQAWARIVAAQPRYAKYQQKTDRELPVIRLTPRAS
jgi:deazaflavin-dependent oxidoreductase (nitroreductase family)